MTPAPHLLSPDIWHCQSQGGRVGADAQAGRAGPSSLPGQPVGDRVVGVAVEGAHGPVSPQGHQQAAVGGVGQLQHSRLVRPQLLQVARDISPLRKLG